jgi:hypothetical protein
VGGHHYPLGCYVGFRLAPERKNPQLQRNFPITKKHVELKMAKMSQLEFGIGG